MSGAKYRGGIRRGVFAGMTKRPKPVTCTDVERGACPEGDLNPHAR
jgi:hypothetical protein